MNKPVLSTAHNPFAVAVGLMSHDRWLLLPLFCLLAFPSLAQLYDLPQESGYFWGSVVVERLLQLLVASIISYRWRLRLQSSSFGTPSFGHVCKTVLLIGGGLWALTLIPVLLLSHVTDPLATLLDVAVSVCAMVIAFRYFFYASVSALLGGNVRDVLSVARAITASRSRAAARAFLGPFALSVLTVGVVASLDPDGRTVYYSTLTSVAENVFWLLSNYTALAFAVVLIDDSVWRSAGLDPYRKERIATIEVQGRGFLQRLFTTPTAVKILFLSTLIWIGNYSRAKTMEPGPSISVKHIVVVDKSVTLTLELNDPTYHFRGFLPSNFTLASDTGYPVATGIISASTDPSSKEQLQNISSDTTHTTLFVTFSTDRSKEDLQKLENLWLWYQLKALIPLKRDALGSGTEHPQPQAPMKSLVNEFLA